MNPNLYTSEGTYTFDRYLKQESEMGVGLGFETD